MIRLLALLLCLPVLAWAQDQGEFPALFDVTGVSADDRLNIRAEPSASAAILGSLVPDARNIEVVASHPGGRWGLVRQAEGSGWVALRYLRRQSPDNWVEDRVALDCAGTEPFWSARTDASRHALRFQFFDDPALLMPVDWALAPQNSRGELGLSATVSGIRAFATIQSEMCSDGMSDHPYGLQITLFMDHYGEDRTTGYSGCCALQR